MESGVARQTLKLLLHTQRAHLKPSRRNRPIKRVTWAYPAAVEKRYVSLLIKWMQPLYDFTLEFIEKHGEAMARGDAADISGIRADALPGGTFNRMVSSLQGWAAQYIPDNPDGVTEGPSLYMGLGELSDELFKANQKQWDKQGKSGIGVTFPDAGDWWAGTKKGWQDANYTLIKSMTSHHITQVNTLTEQAVVNGWSVKLLAAEIRNVNTKNSDGKIKQIARDQIGTLNSMVTQARMRSIGLELYVWSTSGDEKVRPSHKLMDGLLCRWDDATVYREDGGKTWKPRPAGAVRLHPGMDIQCRCVALAYFDELVNEVDTEIDAKKHRANEMAGKPVLIPKLETLKTKSGDTNSALVAYKTVHAKTKKNFQHTANQVYANAPPEQQQALKSFTGSGFVEINDMLYKKWQFSPEEEVDLKWKVAQLDKIIKQYKLDKDIITYRGTEAKYYIDWKVGTSYLLLAFVSTSTNKNTEIVQGGGFHIELRIKQGTVGMYVGELSSLHDEEEFLLGRGLKYNVIEKTENAMIVEVSND